MLKRRESFKLNAGKRGWHLLLKPERLYEQYIEVPRALVDRDRLPQKRHEKQLAYFNCTL